MMLIRAISLKCDLDPWEYKVTHVSEVSQLCRAALLACVESQLITSFRLASLRQTSTVDYRVCQMLSWCTKNSLHSINIWDTVSDVLPLCSVYQAPSYEPNLAFLGQFPMELACLSMLFIHEVVCTACSSNKQTLTETMLAMWDFFRLIRWHLVYWTQM